MNFSAGVIFVTIFCTVSISIDAAADQGVNVRLGYHSDFDRIVFDWDQPTDVHLVRSGEIVKLTFDHGATYRIGAKPEHFGERLIAASEIASAPSKQFLLQLAPDSEIRTVGMDNNRVVIDVMPPSPIADVSKIAAKRETELVAENRSDIETVEPEVNVRLGYHPDFDRLVFDWNQSTGIRLTQTGDIVTLTFDYAATYHIGAKPEHFGERLIAASEVASAPSEQFRLQIAQDATFRTIDMDDNRVVVDILKPQAETASAKAHVVAEPAPDNAGDSLPVPAPDVVTPLLDTIPPEFRDDYRALFKTPGDLNLLFDLARRVESASTANLTDRRELSDLAKRLYDRMLLINANLSEVRLRLGLLHFRLGEYTSARTQLSQIVNDSDMADQRATIEAYLAEIADALSAHQISGSLLAGVRHQTNANAAPSSRTVFSGGDARELDDGARANSDQDVFLSLVLIDRYDPGLQSNGRIEGRLASSIVKQRSEDESDTLALSLRLGPRLIVNRDVEGLATATPYLLVRGLGVDNDLFSVDVGGGLDVEKQLTRVFSADANLQVVHQRHNETSARPDNKDRDGAEIEANFGIRYQPKDLFALSGGPFIRINDARSEARAFNEYGFQAGFQIHHFNLLKPAFTQATTGLDLRWSRALYDAPDPEITDAIRRDEDLYEAQLTIEFPLTLALSLVASGGYLNVDSSIANFDYDNWDVALAVAYRL